MIGRPRPKAGAVEGTTSASDTDLPYVPCSEDPELWFFTDEQTMRQARRICLTECLPNVREACGRIALAAERDLAVDNRFGVFGGTYPIERWATAKAAREAAAAAYAERFAS